MNTTPSDAAIQRKTAAKLLDFWAKREDTARIPRNMKNILADFQTHSSKAYELLAGDDPVDLAERGVWLLGSPTRKGSPPLWPVATASALAEADGSLKAEVRLALISDENAVTTARAWRFDLPEKAATPSAGRRRRAVSPAGIARPMGHVQPVNSWHRNGDCRCVIHPHIDSGESCSARSAVTSGAVSRGFALPLVNETHPAFPLPAQTLPGLVVAMLLSLYGAPEAGAIVEQSKVRFTGGASLMKDIDRVLGK